MKQKNTDQQILNAKINNTSLVTGERTNCKCQPKYISGGDFKILVTLIQAKDLVTLGSASQIVDVILFVDMDGVVLNVVLQG